MYKLPREVTLQIANPQAAKLYDTIGLDTTLSDMIGHDSLAHDRGY